MKNSYFWGKNIHDMLNIDILTFNLFEEKTYIVSQGNGYCVIVDPGCSNEAERQTLIKALTDKSLTPTAVLLTHGHLDHVYGAAFIQKTYRDIPVYLNPADIKVMELTGAESLRIPGIRMLDGIAADYAEEKKLLKLKVILISSHVWQTVQFILS